MLDNIKHTICLKTIDKNIFEKKFDIALEKLNFLIKEEFKLSTTYLKRGRLCKKLLMFDDAYSDFTYVIGHCAKKNEAYYERVLLNFEMGNFYEAISDSNVILTWDKDNFEIIRIKMLSLIFLKQNDVAKNYIMMYFDANKYKILHFLFQEVAFFLAKDEFLKGFMLLESIELFDKENPIKILKEANIYALIGNKIRQDELLNKINNIFPKYFVSHFKFKDMYQEKDLLEINFLLELEIFDKQGLFLYPFRILEGYKNHLEGHILDSKECFEKAIKINPHKPEAYVLLAQTLQLMSGYDNPDYKYEAINNYKRALEIYKNENLLEKIDEMKRQIKHLNSKITLK